MKKLRVEESVLGTLTQSPQKLATPVESNWRKSVQKPDMNGMMQQWYKSSPIDSIGTNDKSTSEDDASEPMERMQLADARGCPGSSLGPSPTPSAPAAVGGHASRLDTPLLSNTITKMAPPSTYEHENGWMVLQHTQQLTFFHLGTVRNFWVSANNCEWKEGWDCQFF